VPEPLEAAEIAQAEADATETEWRDLESVFTFRPSVRYALYFSVATVVTLMFVFSLAARFDWGGLFFLGVGLVGMLWSGDQLLSRIELDATELRLRRPWRQPRQVAFRQMDALQIAGRLFAALVFTYHPLQDDGLLDLQDLHTLTLPAVEEQELLLSLLKARAAHLRMAE
jgi:hypothetical protein